MEKLRIDKWLWSVRIFKSRSLSKDACASNNVKVNEKVARPALSVSVGDMVHVKKNGFNYEYEVIKLIEKRVGAKIAVECYKDLTPESELNKYKDWFIGKAAPERREKGAGRPTKKERRELEGFKGPELDNTKSLD